MALKNRDGKTSQKDARRDLPSGIRRSEAPPRGRRGAPERAPVKPQQIKTRPQKRRAPRPEPEQAAELTLVRGGAGRSRPRRWIFLLGAVLLAALIVFMHLRAPGGLLEWTANYTAGLGSGDGFPVKASDGLPGGLHLSDGDLYLLSKNTLYAFNAQGRTVYSRTHGFSDPVQAVSRSRVLTYDRGGTQFRVDNKSKRLFEHKLDQPIIAGAVSDHGAFALASRATGGYASKLLVFDADFKEIYSRSFTKYLVSAAAMSSDGKTVAVSVIGAESGAYISTVSVFSVKSAQPVAEVRYPDRFVFRLEFLGDNLIAAASENAFAVLDRKGKTMGEYSADGFRFTAFAKTSAGSAALFTDGNAGVSRLALFDAGGRLSGNFDAAGATSDLSASGGELYLLGEGGVSVYTAKGKRVRAMEAPPFAEGLAAFAEGAYVFDSEQVSYLK